MQGAVPVTPVPLQGGEQPTQPQLQYPVTRSEQGKEASSLVTKSSLPSRASPGLTWMMKPVEEHCRTQRLNFRFFLFRSSLSVHVAMNTGSSSIRGSCSTCQESQSRDAGRQHELRGSLCLGSNLVLAFDQPCDLG